MSTLQLGLMVIGGLVVAGVWFYNRWSTRQYAPRRRIMTRSDDAASLLDIPPAEGEDDLGIEPRMEPVWQPDLSVNVLDDAETSTPATEQHPPVPQPVQIERGKGLLDPLVDVIAPLVLDHLVSGEAVQTFLPRSRRVGSKPFSVEGLNVLSQEWESPRPGQRYSALQTGVQLSNRAGPLNEIEFSEFVLKVQDFAEALMAAPDFPDMMHEVRRARELDQFASAHDALLSFTVRAGHAAWSPGYLTQQASYQGLVPGSLPGRLVLPGIESGSAPILVLQFATQAALAEDPEQSAVREFEISLDVPHVPREQKGFARMRGIVIQLAQAMEGTITDDMGRLINADTMDRIEEELELIYDALEERGFEAGSPLARRLFS